MKKTMYSAEELAKLRLPVLPGTATNIRRRADKEQWSSREVPARGGRRGVRTEYAPPEYVLKEIRAAMNSAAAEREISQVADIYMSHKQGDSAGGVSAVQRCDAREPTGTYERYDRIEANQRIRNASQLLVGLVRETGYDPGLEWITLLQEAAWDGASDDLVTRMFMKLKG